MDVNSIGFDFMENPNNAFELAFSIKPEFKKVVNDYQFVWATSNDLQFKHIFTRQTLHIPY